jgi:hypothetical protein
MATSQYKEWIRRGRPYVLIRPAREIQGRIKAYGITVYDYPNQAHLTTSKPEDHTPFSFTKWPIVNQNVDGRGRAIDIMPRNDSEAARRENADIARQIIADKDADVPGTEPIKYMNWTDEAGVCRQENWKSGKRVTVKSSDKGHVHVSFRDDKDDFDTKGYDPVARMRGQVTAEGDDDMGKQLLALHEPSGAVFVCDLVFSRWVDNEQHLGDIQYLADQMGIDLTPHAGHANAEWTEEGLRKGWSEEVFGVLVGPRPPGMDDEPDKKE